MLSDFVHDDALWHFGTISFANVDDYHVVSASFEVVDDLDELWGEEGCDDDEGGAVGESSVVFGEVLVHWADGVGAEACQCGENGGGLLSSVSWRDGHHSVCGWGHVVGEHADGVLSVGGVARDGGRGGYHAFEGVFAVRSPVGGGGIDGDDENDHEVGAWLVSTHLQALRARGGFPVDALHWVACAVIADSDRT